MTVSPTDIHNLTNMLGRCARQLERIANALERMSPPPAANSATTPPTPVAIPAEGPNIMDQGF